MADFMTSTLKHIARKQQQNRLDQLAQMQLPLVPQGGWIYFVRQTLGMTGEQLGKRLGGISKASISQKQKAELDGSITLKSLQEVADAMECDLVYALVPRQPVEQILGKQAKKRAEAIVKNASTHMLLENQGLAEQTLKARVETLQKELVETMAKGLWDE